MGSIESADEDKFWKIRGGELSKVKRSISALLTERNLRNISNPVIGFTANFGDHFHQNLHLITRTYFYPEQYFR